MWYDILYTVARYAVRKRTYAPSDKENLLVLAALLADKNQSSVFSQYSTVPKLSLYYIITIKLHFCDANISLFQEDKKKEMDPLDQAPFAYFMFLFSL